ncbi:hypothetical protein [Flammeovirga kamogawensis]|uniref:Nuclear transport factor 2 family protein n=1 Tax=Flammeovirga kamogawensis TaxID=373891 RepID=A0ABX8H1I2_9BACT|nr:hypothetical protein [Flammeovirga kamogawensis]MBB6462560.1 hypothetical protein [Flammeovirga kamogawensis]QWG09690.1 hypothetical protein KM029_24105 [Flammeovirga kamogawensis]TRX65202.1 hypothetical protein EO216_22000 [Flammeovirga kamogawensis]
MKKRIFSFILLMIPFISFAQNKLDHQEAKDYVDYYIYAYNIDTPTQVNKSIVSDGAYLSNRDIHFDYSVFINPKSDYPTRKDFYKFLLEIAYANTQRLEILHNEYTANYDIIISYYFEDDSCLVIYENTNHLTKVCYFNAEKNLIKTLEYKNSRS